MAKEVISENEAAVANAVSKTEKFLNDNIKVIWAVIAACFVLAAAGFAYYHYAYLPKKSEALAQMFKAEQAFRAENYDLALNGDGNVLGFEQIISEYGSKAGKAVYMYAAICQLKAGNPDEALKYINKYSAGDDQIMAGRAEALKGDAYADKGDYAKAARCFVKAAEISDNVFSAGYLLKAGQAYEAAGENAKALEAYNEIKDKYSNSIEAYDILRYIAAVEAK